MLTLKQLAVAFAFATVAAAAVAGVTDQAGNARAGMYPECRNGASTGATEPGASIARPEAVNANGVDEGELGAFDEYLSFHAQVTEGSGKFLLMPWPQLRTHFD